MKEKTLDIIAALVLGAMGAVTLLHGLDALIF
jgi:hypothetical protein